MRVLSTYSVKGGVGKTSAAVNLAYLAASGGEPTLLWDLDPQGAATYLFRIKPKVKGGAKALVKRRRPIDLAIRATDHANLDVVPADLSYRHFDLALNTAKRPTHRLATLLRPLASEYSVVILDCAPSISLVSESIFGASDALLVPMIPTALSERTLTQLIGFLSKRRTRPQLLTFFSLADRRKKLHREVMTTLRPKEVTVLDAVIPSAIEVEQMGVRRAPVCAFAPNSRAALCYQQLWHQVRTACS